MKMKLKRLVVIGMLWALYALNATVVAQNSESGFFNSLAVGVNVGSTGVGFDVATPVGRFLAVRAGAEFMPNINFHTDVDVDVVTSVSSATNVSSLEVEGALKRVSGDLLVNLYPIPSVGFFVCAGAYFGGEELIKVKGHSAELAEMIEQGSHAGIEIGDYSIPVDQNGNVMGGLKVSKVRPYVGLGFGRAVPNSRLGFMVDLGVQIHGTPEVYSDSGDLRKLAQEADNDFTKVIDKLKVYPVLKFRLCGKIF